MKYWNNFEIRDLHESCHVDIISLLGRSEAK